jgi:hypothetical protein
MPSSAIATSVHVSTVDSLKRFVTSFLLSFLLSLSLSLFLSLYNHGCFLASERPETNIRWEGAEVVVVARAGRWDAVGGARRWWGFLFYFLWGWEKEGRSRREREREREWVENHEGRGQHI